MKVANPSNRYDSGIRYEYFRIVMPCDISDSIADLREMAFLEARETASTYAIPADWEIIREIGSFDDHYEMTFIIRRRRRAMQHELL